MALVLVILNDLEGHFPVAGLFKCNLSNICAVFYQISTDSVLAWSLSESWASCTKCCSLQFPRWSCWRKMRSGSGWVSRSWLRRRIFWQQFGLLLKFFELLYDFISGMEILSHVSSASESGRHQATMYISCSFEASDNSENIEFWLKWIIPVKSQCWFILWKMHIFQWMVRRCPMQDKSWTPWNPGQPQK